MTHTEAADLILSEADAPPMDWYLPEVRDAILAAVATVMNAARAEEHDAALECRAAIRARAQAHREPKP